MYEQIARYYDLLHADLTEDIGFLLTLASRADGAILELGCGSGRVLLPLSRAGHQIVGLDNSPAMLVLAQAKLENTPASLIEADMTAFALELPPFSLTLIPYNTFMHLPPDEARKMLGCVREHLTPAGQLFIDLANPFVVEQTPNDSFLTLEGQLTDPVSGELVMVLASNWLERENQELKITWLYDAMPPAGGNIQRIVSNITYHYYFPHEIELLLQETGFRLKAIYGNYNQTPFNEASPRLLILAERLGALQ